jgi:hypothetical protein
VEPILILSVRPDFTLVTTFNTVFSGPRPIASSPDVHIKYTPVAARIGMMMNLTIAIRFMT